MKILIKAVGEMPKIVEIENTLESMQKAVGGYIEVVRFASDMAVICNEEGIPMNLPFNIRWIGHSFFGTMFLVGVDDEHFTDVDARGEDYFKMIENEWIEIELQAVRVREILDGEKMMEGLWTDK